MQIKNAHDTPWEEVSGHRHGKIEFKRLLRGADPQNYELSLVRTGDEYRTPRHRHNYDQVRFGLTGYTNYAPGKDLGPGQVGFFPEGTHYGMQRVVGSPVVMAVQSTGVSGEAFMSYDQLRQGGRALLESTGGSFEGDGVFAWTDGSGLRRQKDSFEAIWEHVMSRPIHYDPARYDEPVIMTLESYSYRPTATPGVQKKFLGVFTEGQTELSMYKLDPGASLEFAGDDRPVMLFTTSGTIQVNGQAWRDQTAVGLASGEHGSIQAEDAVELVYYAMPKLEVVLANQRHIRREPMAADD